MTPLSNGSASVVVEQLRAWNPQAVSQVVEYRGETTVVVPRELIRATAQQCKENPALDFNLLSDATCADRFPMEPRFELNYHLVSLARRDRVRLRSNVSAQQPVVDSLVPVWPGANWLEREISTCLAFALKDTRICGAFFCRTVLKDFLCAVIFRRRASVSFLGADRHP